MLVKACAISDEKDVLGILRIFPFFQLLKSGLFFVIVSGSMRLEPVSLKLRYSFNASIASCPRNVLANSFVFCVMMWI
jgi:hypothetical protein